VEEEETELYKPIIFPFKTTNWVVPLLSSWEDTMRGNGKAQAPSLWDKITQVVNK
jgi:hypothetical protein